MSHFTQNIRAYVVEELDRASNLMKEGKPDAAFRHLENAHILGQESTHFHVLAHLHMAAWAIRQRDIKELFGLLKLCLDHHRLKFKENYINFIPSDTVSDLPELKFASFILPVSRLVVS